MRTWALSAGLSLVAGCSAVDVDPYVVPADQLSEIQKKRVDHVLEDVAAVVPLEAAEVKSRLDIYDFLLDEMPFTGGIVRELGRGKWEITRDPTDPALTSANLPCALSWPPGQRSALRRKFISIFGAEVPLGNRQGK